MTLGERVAELRALAIERGVADQVGDIPDPKLAVGAYAEVLGLDPLLVYDLTLTLREIQAA